MTPTTQAPAYLAADADRVATLLCTRDELMGFLRDLGVMADSLVRVIEDAPDQVEDWRHHAAAALARQIGMAISLAAAAHGQKSARSDAEWWMPSAAGSFIHEANWRADAIRDAAAASPHSMTSEPAEGGARSQTTSPHAQDF